MSKIKKHESHPISLFFSFVVDGWVLEKLGLTRIHKLGVGKFSYVAELDVLVIVVRDFQAVEHVAVKRGSASGELSEVLQLGFDRKSLLAHVQQQGFQGLESVLFFIELDKGLSFFLDFTKDEVYESVSFNLS